MKKRKITSFCLVFIILLSMFSFPAHAVEESLIVLSTQDDLLAFSERVNSGESNLDAVLIANITLDTNFVPIGKNTSTPYNGEFNGNGYTITLNITEPLSYAGVFGVVGVNGKVLNLKSAGIVSGSYTAGGIAGLNKGTIYNCSNIASITSLEDNAGGITGFTASTSLVEHCFNTGNVVASRKYAGGIIGLSRGNVFDCYNTARISGTSNIGGVVGAASSGIVKNSFSYSDNKSICGYTSSSAEIINCYYLGIGADGRGANATKFANGHVAHYLNTTTLTEANRGVWAQGNRYPVFVSESNKAVYQVTFKIGMQTNTNYTNTDGTVDFPAIDGKEITWYHNGELIDKNCIITGDFIFNGFVENAATSAISVTIPKTENNIPYDIKPMFEDDIIYFFMPSISNLSALTYNLLDKNGDIVNTITADFTTDEIHIVNLSYGDYEIKALKSELPALFLNIDENYGTIDSMNSSADHSVSCYGDLKLVVPDHLKEKYGWEDVTSKEDDSKNPGSMNMKGRGNSSWSAELGVKKAYQIKVEKKTSFLGMDKSKKWCILRDNVDLYKNPLAFELAREMEMQYSCESEYSDVYMNGEYLGTYLITDKIEIGSASVDITDLDDAFEENNDSVDGLDLTGGYLLEIDNTVDDLQFNASGNKITIKGPEDLSKTASSNGPYEYIISKTKNLFSAIYGDGYLSDGSHFMEHIDIESFAKYFWHQELLGNKDCGSGSTYLYKDSDLVDPKFHAGPIWDNDYALTQSEGWILPNLKRGNVSSGSDTLYKALCTHKEFVSYLLQYYKSGISEKLEKAPEILSKAISQSKESEIMNSIKWNKNNKLAADDDTKILNQRLAWLKENYLDIIEFATKGEFTAFKEYPIKTYTLHGGSVTSSSEAAMFGDKVTLTAIPSKGFVFEGWVVEEGNFELPNTPTVTFVMPESNIVVKAVFKDEIEREVIASYTFGSINGVKSGYIPDIGYAKLTVSADGVNKSDLRLNTDDFSSSVAIFSGTETIPYEKQAYLDIEFDSRKYTDIAFCAYIGGKNAAPLSWKIMYSTDGINYTELEDSSFTLTKAYDMKEAYYNIKVPVQNTRTAHIRLVTNSEVTVDGGTFVGATFGEAAFDNITILGVDTGVEITDNPISLDGSATKVENKIVLQLSTTQKLSSEILHYAFFDNDDHYVDYGMVPVLKENDEFYIVVNDIGNAKYAKFFVWKDLTTLTPLSDTLQVNISN